MDRGQRDATCRPTGVEDQLMAQFQVYRLGGGQLVLDLQTDLINTGSRVVAPLIVVSTGPKVIGRLEPVFEINGEDHALHTAEMAAIPSGLLRG